MNLYGTLDAAYQHLTRRPVPPAWRAELGDFTDLDVVVGAIRDDRPDPRRSDTVLRVLVTLGRRDRAAMTVALYALAPALRARLGRAVTDEYRADALADLAFVLLDSPLDRPGLAHRLVNRAHTRVWKAAGRVHQRGIVSPVGITPQDPQVLTRKHGAIPDFADDVTQRVDLSRFHAAVRHAVANGDLSERAWAAYRDHRLRRGVDPTGPSCSGTERKLAGRAAPRLQPLIDRHLHAA